MKKTHMKQLVIPFSLFLSLGLAQAATLSASLSSTQGEPLGEVVFEDSQYGLLIKPNLLKLPAGVHGFHIHQLPDCGEHGMKAGEHWDPGATKSHQGPYGQGHLGDLPALVVDNQGTANLVLLAPRLKTQDIQGHSLMIHGGGDNYTDNPPSGGGGTRIACGKIPS